MTEFKSTLTVLTCQGVNTRATKKFTKLPCGKIKKESSKSGIEFTCEEIVVSSLNSLADVLLTIESDHKKTVIRGVPKSSLHKLVRRKMYGIDAAFESASRPYLMLDIDKQLCPDYFDPMSNPEEIILWIQELLPEPFRSTSCFYKFSASQNVNPIIKGNNRISVHLWYWCDKEVSDDEWKRYFRVTSAPVDTAVFNAVQMHFTANPIFENMDNPLPVRSGIIKGNSNIVKVPIMPEISHRACKPRVVNEFTVTEDNKDKALKILLPFYKEGSRNSFSGALASILYRRGWNAAETADFIYGLALSSGDEEADHRHKNSLRICSAVDENRPTPGIPTLQKYVPVEDLQPVLILLGVGDPDLEAALAKLSNRSSADEVKVVLRELIPKSGSDHALYIDKINIITKFTKKMLNLMLNEVAKEGSRFESNDWADVVINGYLRTHYEAGKHFLRSSDKRYWRYNLLNWEIAPDDFVKKEVLSYARDVRTENELGLSLSHLLGAALNLLEGEAYEKKDPFKLVKMNMPLVMNLKNGELWFDQNADTKLKPHRADSYLRHCLNVEYDPEASCPRFNSALLDIFSKSTNPEAMRLHFMELAGYICQPWRKIPYIVLFYGRGANGKSSLNKILCNVLGPEAVMSGRINEIMKDKFKLGDLDGKLMLCEDDVGTNTLLDDGFLKMIGEEKILTGEQKYKPSYQFICRAVPVMLSNGYPAISDLSDGMHRRLIVIPFKHQFNETERNPELFDEIWREESAGIVREFIEGFQRFKRRGRFSEPSDCITAKNTWILRANILPTFIEDSCNTGEGRAQFLRDFYSIFRDYCESTGSKPILRQQAVRNRLESLGYEVSEKDGQPYIRGIMAVNRTFREH